MTLYITIILATMLSAMLTFFSGFGLGTILLPVFAIFFPIHIAVAMTAIVHLTNNLFKFSLMHRHVDWTVLKRFGLPALFAAFLGAWLLATLSHDGIVLIWELGDHQFKVTMLKLIIGGLMIVFALFEVLPFIKNWRVESKWLPFGGMLSGFFGGLSGHQGALRSVFLLRVGMSKEIFIGTGIAVAVLVDLARLLVYGAEFNWSTLRSEWSLIGIATLSALVGTLVGRRLLHAVTFLFVERLVFALLLAIGFALASGII